MKTYDQIIPFFVLMSDNFSFSVYFSDFIFIYFHNLEKILVAIAFIGTYLR